MLIWRKEHSALIACLSSKLASGRCSGNASNPGDAIERLRKNSLLRKRRVCGIGSSGDTERVPVERRFSGGVQCALGGSGKSWLPSRSVPIIRSKPLVNSANESGGSQQNRYVPAIDRLAQGTGSVVQFVSLRSSATTLPVAQRHAAGPQNTSSCKAADEYEAVDVGLGIQGVILVQLLHTCVGHRTAMCDACSAGSERSTQKLVQTGVCGISDTR